MSRPISFGLVGGAWRAEFFFRIAQALPERFRVVGCVTKNAARRERIKTGWNIPVFDQVDGLLNKTPDFVVTSVPWAASGPLLLEQYLAHPQVSEHVVPESVRARASLG